MSIMKRGVWESLIRKKRKFSPYDQDTSEMMSDEVFGKYAACFIEF